MSLMAIKFFNRNGMKTLRLTSHYFRRMTSTDQPCSSNSNQTESSKPKEPCPPKVEPCPPPPASLTPKPEPCPPMPQCPPTICPPVLDSNNPCNYCPPPCPDPNFPDVTKLKKAQCLFQEENEIPVYLKKGNFDALLVQTTYLLNIIAFIYCLHNSFLIAIK